MRGTTTLIRPCISLLIHRVTRATGCTGSLKLQLRSICCNNNAPATLSTGRLSHITGTVGSGFDLSALHRCAIRTNEPSAIASRGLTTLGSTKINEVDVGPRDFGSSILTTVNEQRAIHRALSTFTLTHRTKFSGVGVSFVTKLPGSSVGSFGRDVRATLSLKTRDIAIRALYLGAKTCVIAHSGIFSRNSVSAIGGVISFDHRCLSNTKCIPCCVCERNGSLNGLRGIN